MGGVMQDTLADKLLIGVVELGSAAKLVRPTEFGTGPIDILTLEVWSDVEFTIGSDNSVPVTWPADEHLFINVRKVCPKSTIDATISDVWFAGSSDLNVIAHCRQSAYADLG